MKVVIFGKSDWEETGTKVEQAEDISYQSRNLYKIQTCKSDNKKSCCG